MIEGLNIFNPPYNVLIILPNDSLGGAEQVLKMISNQFKNSKVIVYFLTSKKTSSWVSKETNIQLRYSKYQNQYMGALTWLFLLLFKSTKKKYTYIFTSHVFITGLTGIFIKLGLIEKDYFIGRESTQIFKRFSGFKLFMYKLMYKFGYLPLDLLICQTEDMKTELLKNVPKLDKITKVKVIPNPIDLEILNKKTSCLEFIGGEFIVTAGRLIPEKGFDLLIKAFHLLKDEKPELRLLILGEGNERDNLQDLIEKYNLGNDVILMGFATNVLDYFKAAKACVISSRVEGFPNVLLQMMAKNTKVVSTKCAGGIEEIEGVFVCEVNDIADLKKNILLALNLNTSANKPLFDSYLSERNIDIFMKKIFMEL
jgi:glycosyltransferase involved in cell wall biosynthesis